MFVAESAVFDTPAPVAKGLPDVAQEKRHFPVAVMRDWVPISDIRPVPFSCKNLFARPSFPLPA